MQICRHVHDTAQSLVRRQVNGFDRFNDAKGGDAMRRLREIFGDDAGATAIEYGLIAALISLAAINTFPVIGDQVGTALGQVVPALGGAGASAS